MSDFNFWLNRQGPQGKQGEKGEQGFSPVITVASDTLSEYTLQIQTANNTFTTTNLRGSVADAGGTYVRYNRSTGAMTAGVADYASTSQFGEVIFATSDDIEDLSESCVVSPKDVNGMIESNIPTVNDATITITQGGTTKGTFTLNQSNNATIALSSGGGGSDYIAGDGIDITDDTISIDLTYSSPLSYSKTTISNEGWTIYTGTNEAQWDTGHNINSLGATYRDEGYIQISTSEYLPLCPLTMVEDEEDAYSFRTYTTLRTATGPYSAYSLICDIGYRDNGLFVPALRFGRGNSGTSGQIATYWSLTYSFSTGFKRVESGDTSTYYAFLPDSTSAYYGSASGTTYYENTDTDYRVNIYTEFKLYKSAAGYLAMDVKSYDSTWTTVRHSDTIISSVAYDSIKDYLKYIVPGVISSDSYNTSYVQDLDNFGLYSSSGTNVWTVGSVSEEYNVNLKVGTGLDVDNNGYLEVDFDEVATAAQGTLADTAIQSVTTGSTNGTINIDGTDVSVYGLGSAAYTASTAYATAAQGALADTALQSGDNVSELTNDAGYLTSSTGVISTSIRSIVQISQSDYDALVNAGTVDTTALYLII